MKTCISVTFCGTLPSQALKDQDNLQAVFRLQKEVLNFIVSIFLVTEISLCCGSFWNKIYYCRVL